jgi:DMSO/TMAO reductase YedYZ molybdopterin-dependent catalytic subunit
MQGHDAFGQEMTRRRLLGAAGIGGLALLSEPALAQTTVDLRAPGGPSIRPITTAFPQKGPMILQRTSPPWLETPFDVFDKGVFTPNDQHFVSWHWADFPGDPDLDKFRLTVRGHVNQTLSLSLKDILQGLPRVEYAAVSQCAGNSRIYTQPRVPGAQWANGSMSNALWTGVRLKDVLDRAGVKPGAVQVRFGGLDGPVVADAPKFLKSLDVDHARDGEVMIAFAMNGEQIPLLNGFPLKLVVPGWCAVYWIKMLNDIEVLDQPDTNYWTARGYRIPDTPHGNVKPSDTGLKLVPVTRNVPRSFITNIHSDDRVPVGAPAQARGIAFGGDCGVARVDLSIDGGKSWDATELGKDEGKYSFRQWHAQFTLPSPGEHTLMIRCTNSKGEAQPSFPIWNPSGYMINTIESTHVIAA